MKAISAALGIRFCRFNAKSIPDPADGLTPRDTAGFRKSLQILEMREAGREPARVGFLGPATEQKRICRAGQLLDSCVATHVFLKFYGHAGRGVITILHQTLGRCSVESSLKILDEIRIASPCHASWDAMTGDDFARHCRSCERTVYNLSAFTAEKAAELIAASEGRICVRMYRRRDGTVITRDCPIGRSELLRKRFRAAIIAVASWLGLLPIAGCTIPSMGSVDPAGKSIDSARKMPAAWRPPRTPVPTQVLIEKRYTNRSNLSGNRFL